VSWDRDRYARIPGRSWRTAPLSALSLPAAGLLLRAWAYCADQMTDGLIPDHELVSLAKGKPPKDAIAELVRHGVWERTESGYRDRVFAENNISKAQWEERKADARDRQEKSRRTRKAPPAPVTLLVTRDVTSDPQTQDARRKTQDALGSASDAGARATPPSLRSSTESRDPLRDALVEGFSRRWETLLGEGAWDATGIREDHVERVLRVVRQRQGPEGELERGLDAYFAHCAASKVRPELGWMLSRDFGAWCARSSLPAGQASSRDHRRSLLRDLAERPIASPEEPAP
jgi:hypothetical protein